jgi:hypothetical protein
VGVGVEAEFVRDGTCVLGWSMEKSHKDQPPQSINLRNSIGEP